MFGAPPEHFFNLVDPVGSKLVRYSGLRFTAGRSEGFPNGIFHPCVLWARGLTRWENCRRAVVGVIWKFRLTFRPGNYIWSFSFGFGAMVRDIWEWRPGFYAEFRYESREHSDLAWGAIFWKMIVKLLIMHFEVHIWTFWQKIWTLRSNNRL